MRQEKPKYGTSFLNPLFILKKNGSPKIVLDAKHLISNTDQSSESWPLEPLATQLAGANEFYESTIDHMYAKALAKTIKLT